MTPKEFCYWLQGSLELNSNKDFTVAQTATLRRHLNMVFAHIAHLPEKEQPEPTKAWTPYGTGERC